MTLQRLNSDRVVPRRIEELSRPTRHRRVASAQARLEVGQNLPPPLKRQQKPRLSKRAAQQKHSSDVEAFPEMTTEEWKRLLQNVNPARILGIFKEFLVDEGYETVTSVNAVDTLLTERFIQRLEEVLFLSRPVSNLKGPKKTYSTLTSEDYRKLLGDGYAGIIEVNPKVAKKPVDIGQADSGNGFYEYYMKQLRFISRAVRNP